MVAMANTSSLTNLESTSPIKWATQVTTVLERRRTLLPNTLKSLHLAGFPDPTIYVDGHKGPWEEIEEHYNVVYREKRIRPYGHWLLAILETMIRNADAHYFLSAQDDFVAYKNLRQYLEYCISNRRYPNKGYWNLFSPENEKLVPIDKNTSTPITGWHLSNQCGKGAVCLVFSRATLSTILATRFLIHKPIGHPNRAYRNIDGAVVEAVRQTGGQEWVHYPSLVQHTGLTSSMGQQTYPLSDSFRGESFDALNLIP